MAALSACDILQERTAYNSSKTVTAKSSATFFALRDGVDTEWKVDREKNTENLPNTRSLVVDDAKKRFSLLFVCESTDSANPTEVYVFHATLADFKFIDHACYKPVESVRRQVISGKVLGLKATAGGKPEVAYFAADRDVQFRAYDSYAARVTADARDIIGFKGEWQADDSIIPSQIIVKTVTVSGSVPSVVDLSFDGDFSRASYMTRDLYTANINGLPVSNWQAKINFQTLKKTTLTLKQFTAPTAQFYGIPVYVTRADGSKIDAFFQAPEGEGHEIVAEVTDANGRITVRGKHMFKEAHDAVSLTIPQPATASASLGFQDGASSTIVASAGTVSDSALGVAQLRQWQIFGRAPEPETLKSGEALITELEWNIFVTQNWLNSTTLDTLTINPFVIQMQDPKKPDVIIDRFKKHWNFAAGTALTWQVHNFAGASDYGKLLDHVMNRNYYDGLVYGETIQYSPPP